tara:strand:+ start:216 stop:401 length:186 start_codon:yes stop_codon:yes gene_type:complete
MTDEEIEEFIKTFKSFMDHASIEELAYMKRETTRKCNETYYKRRAKEMNVEFDYYMKEFVI